MNAEEMAGFRRFFESSWPMARAWPESAWEDWAGMIMSHGASYVRLSVHSLLRDPRWTEFPPTLAAVLQAIELVEEPTRERIRFAERRIARLRDDPDENHADQIEQTEERLVQLQGRLER